MPILTRQQVREFDLSKVKKVHMIGLLSPFSSFCATKLLAMGKNLKATEYVQDDPVRKKWEEKGILYPGYGKADYINSSLDLVVYPNGIVPGNPEWDQTKKLDLPAMSIGQLTGLVTKDLKTIAVAGTHGKSTTTALIVWLLQQTLGNPNYILGENIIGQKSNWHINEKNPYFVVESCEYKRQFLDRAPAPYISVITNIDLDHTDYYKDQADYNSAFIEFLTNTKKVIVYDKNWGPNEEEVITEVKKENPKVSLSDTSRYSKKIESVLVGQHNQENLQRALAVGKALNIKETRILKAFKAFPGLAWRFELLGKTKKGAQVYRDYAHNPAKIEACLQGAKETFPRKKIILVFQPHTFERSYTFKDQFAKAISKANTVIISNIFTHKRESEEDKSLITEEEFTQILDQANPQIKVVYAGGLDKTADIIKKFDQGSKSIIILASAGDLPKIAKGVVLED